MAKHMFRIMAEHVMPSMANMAVDGGTWQAFVLKHAFQNMHIAEHGRTSVPENGGTSVQQHSGT